MTAVTECLGSACQADEVVSWSIPRKWIAGILFSVLSGVAPLAHAASQPSPAATTTGQPGQPMPNHSCCPRVHPIEIPPIAAEFPPDSVPCRQHPCCVSHAPDAPPSLPAASGVRGPSVKEPSNATTSSGFQLRFIRDTFSNARFQPYPSWSVVLRI